MKVALSDLLKQTEMTNNSIEFEEKLGEQRITFFLSVCGVAMALVGFAVVKLELTEEKAFWLMIGVLSSLLLYGLHTLNRMNWRAINIRNHTYLLKLTLEAFARDNPFVNEYRDRLGKAAEKKDQFWILEQVKRAKGTTAEFMYLTNGLIATGIGLTVQLHEGSGDDWRCVIAVCVVVFLATFFGLWATSLFLRNRFGPRDM